MASTTTTNQNAVVVPDILEQFEESLTSPSGMGDTTQSDRKNTLTLTTIQSLPVKLLIKIFKSLDQTSSTCFGLTSRKFYPIYKEFHRRVPLIACYLHREGGKFLFGLLRNWMTEGGLFWSKREVKFVTAERLAEIRSYPIKQKLLEAKVWRRLEMLNDEKQIGGWWEHGAWIDGMASGKGTARWIGLQFSLEWEGEEDEVYKLRA